MTTQYLVKVRTSKSQKWGAILFEDTVSDAIEAAKEAWENLIDDNAYVDVRIERQVR